MSGPVRTWIGGAIRHFRCLLAALFLGPPAKPHPRQGWKRGCVLLRKEVWDKESYGLHRLVKVALVVGSFVFPTVHIDQLFQSKDPRVIGVSRESLFYLPRVLFFIWAGFDAPATGGHIGTVFCYTALGIMTVVWYFIASIVHHLAGTFLVWGHLSLSAARSLLWALINYCEIVLGFAFLYRYSDGLNGLTGPISPLESVYFSMVTASTMGAGNIQARTPGAKALVVTQVFVTLLFVTLFLADLVSRIRNAQGGHPPTANDT